MFLMPSQFEPCGLSQLIAMRYGTLPIVRETGGLRDTVLSYNEATGDGNGFSFFNYNAHDMLHTIQRALEYYHDHKDVWQLLQKRGMTTDYSWTRSAGKYMELYRGLLGESELRDPTEPESVPVPSETEVKKPKTTRKRTTAKKEEGTEEKKPAARKRTTKTTEAASEAKPARKTSAKKTAEEKTEAAAEKPARKRSTAKKSETAGTEAPKPKTTRKKKTEETKA